MIIIIILHYSDYYTMAFFSYVLSVVFDPIGNLEDMLFMIVRIIVAVMLRIYMMTNMMRNMMMKG